MRPTPRCVEALARKPPACCRLLGKPRSRGPRTMTFRPWLVGPCATMYSIPVSYTSMGRRYLTTVPAMLKFLGLSTLKLPLKK